MAVTSVVWSPKEIERGNALFEAINLLPAGATPTAVLYVMEEILAKRRQMKSESRYPKVELIAVDPSHISALVRFLGGPLQTSLEIKCDRQTLYTYILRGRMPQNKWEQMRQLAKIRMEAILQ